MAGGGTVSGIAVASIGAGVLLAYAGIRGKSVLGELRGLVTGKPPSSAPVVAPIAGTAAAAAAGTGGGGTAAAPSGPGEQAWISAFLGAIGAPASAANVSSVTSWIAHEGPYGTQGQNNPLNTTLDMPGATSFDGLAVKNYPSAQEGIQATAATIEGGNYADILMALRSGNGLCGRSWAGLSTWSDGGYSQVC